MDDLGLIEAPEAKPSETSTPCASIGDVSQVIGTLTTANKSSEYDHDNSLLILKTFQLQPQLFRTDANRDLVIHTLAKALMNSSSHNFFHLTCLLSEEMIANPQIASVVDMGTLLTQCSYREFWAKAKTVPQLRKLPNFVPTIQKAIISSLQSVHQTIPRAVLIAQLNMEEGTPEVDDCITRNDWVCTDGQINFALNQENQMRQKQFKENMEYEQLAEIVTMLSS
jgi:hypothetical protein